MVDLKEEANWRERIGWGGAGWTGTGMLYRAAYLRGKYSTQELQLKDENMKTWFLQPSTWKSKKRMHEISTTIHCMYDTILTVLLLWFQLFGYEITIRVYPSI